MFFILFNVLERSKQFRKQVFLEDGMKTASTNVLNVVANGLGTNNVLGEQGGMKSIPTQYIECTPSNSHIRRNNGECE